MRCAPRGAEVEVIARRRRRRARRSQAMFEHLRARWGGVDIVVNNAAIDARRLRDADDPGGVGRGRGGQPARRVPVRAPGAAADDRAPAGGASSTSISPAALLGKEGAANYAAAKGGLLSFTKSLAREVGALRHHRQRRLPGPDRYAPDRRTCRAAERDAPRAARSRSAASASPPRWRRRSAFSPARLRRTSAAPRWSSTAG